MGFSLMWRQHWKLVASALVLAAGFLLAAPVPALVSLGAGAVILGGMRLARRPARGGDDSGEAMLGAFGFVEVGGVPQLARERG
jgi:hypothetical protein